MGEGLPAVEDWPGNPLGHGGNEELLSENRRGTDGTETGPRVQGAFELAKNLCRSYNSRNPTCGKTIASFNIVDHGAIPGASDALKNMKARRIGWPRRGMTEAET